MTFKIFSCRHPVSTDGPISGQTVKKCFGFYRWPNFQTKQNRMKYFEHTLNLFLKVAVISPTFLFCFLVISSLETASGINCRRRKILHTIKRNTNMHNPCTLQTKRGVSWPSGLAYRTQVLVLATECGFESRP